MTTIKSLLISLLLFFAPIQALFLIVLFSVILDTIFGIWSSKKLGKPLISRKFFRAAKKMFIYWSGLALAFFIDKFIFNGIMLHFFSIDFAFTKIATLIFISIELFSIDEKIKNANDGKGIWFYTKRLIKLAKSVKEEYKELTKKDKE